MDPVMPEECMEAKGAMEVPDLPCITDLEDTIPGYPMEEEETVAAHAKSYWDAMLEKMSEGVDLDADLPSIVCPVLLEAILAHGKAVTSNESSEVYYVSDDSDDDNRDDNAYSLGLKDVEALVAGVDMNGQTQRAAVKHLEGSACQSQIAAVSNCS